MHSLLPNSPHPDLPTLISTLMQIEPLLDAMPEVVFFIKDTQTRYALVNQTLAQRLGFKSKDKLVGMTAEQVFPASFGPSYTAQDRRVLDGGTQLDDQLELHLYYGNQPVWCLTHKLALRNRSGDIIGLAGISRDVQLPQSGHPACSCRNRATRPTRSLRRWMPISASTSPGRSAWPSSPSWPDCRWRNWSATASASSNSPRDR